MAWQDTVALIALAIYLGTLAWKFLEKAKNGHRVFAVGHGKRGFSKVLEWTFPLGLAMLFGLVFVTATGWFSPRAFAPWFDAPPVHTTGALLALLGATGFAWAAHSMRDAFRMGIDTTKTYSLVTRGAFKHSRNPTYVSMWMLFGGYFLLYPNAFFLGAFVFMVFALSHQIAREEFLLEKTFSEQYLHYKNATPKYIFFR